MAPSSPVRVGLIGLAANLNPMGAGAWGGMAHLPSLLESPHYKIVALCNSSEESARNSIAAHKLPAETKVYGSPEALAADPDVDLVVVSVNVAKHQALATPALKAGKQVYVEWPLGASTKEAQELATLAQEKGIKGVVGLQGRASPWFVKVKELIDSGAIGKVTATTVESTFGPFSKMPWPKSAEYYMKLESGGNAYHITFAHFLGPFIHILGSLNEVSSVIKTLNPTVALVDNTGKVVEPAAVKTAPDHISVQGILASGALASLTFRSSYPTTDGVILRWIITGTEGELELIMKEPGMQIQMSIEEMELSLRRADEPETKKISLGDDVKVGGRTYLPGPATNISMMYEAMATDDQTKLTSFDEALELHKLLDRILAASL